MGLPRLADLQTLFSSDEAAFRAWLCRELGCAPASGPTAPPLAAVTGTVAEDAFHFPVLLTGPTGGGVQLLVLDTGAFELLLAGPVAASLGLPNLGALEVAGVGGDSAAYQSEVSVSIGGHPFGTVRCVVDPGFTLGPGLFGLRFFVTRRLALTLDLATAQLTMRATD